MIVGWNKFHRVWHLTSWQLETPDLDQSLEGALRGPPSGEVSAALSVIGKLDNRDGASWFT
jgi:hypothetical protein